VKYRFEASYIEDLKQRIATIATTTLENKIEGGGEKFAQLQTTVMINHELINDLLQYQTRRIKLICDLKLERILMCDLGEDGVFLGKH
jgi:hypothetical protein